jgi:hypothetical protein
MPDGMRARGKGGLLQLPPPPQGPIYLACHDLARAIDSAARDSASHPCAQELDLFPKVCPLSNLMLHLGSMS